jgi:hypothetical protein
VINKTLDTAAEKTGNSPRVFDAKRLEELAKIKQNEATRPSRNVKKAAKVSQESTMLRVLFTFPGGNTVTILQTRTLARKMGMKLASAGIIQKEIERNGKKITTIVAEKTVMTKPIKVSLGRRPVKRKKVTKGGRALGKGGKTVGGGTTAYAKDWHTIQVPKSASIADILLYVSTFKKPVYEIGLPGNRSLSLKDYLTSTQKQYT